MIHTLNRRHDRQVVLLSEDIVVFRNADPHALSIDVHFSPLENHQRYSGL
jgi:hypothetical protein